MNTLPQSAEIWLRHLAMLSWKGALLVIAVWLVMLLFRRRMAPAWRHGLWLLALVRFVAPDVGASSLSLNAAAAALPPPVLERTPASPLLSQNAFVADEVMPPVEPSSLPVLQEMPAVITPPPSVSWELSQWLALVWLLGVAAVLGVMTWLHLRLSRRLRCDRSEPCGRLVALLDDACGLAGVRRCPQLIVTDAVSAPALFGVLRPAILLPRAVAANHDAEALRLILLHELAHWRRGDLWAQLAAALITALHWFNPLVWLAGRRMRAEAEMAADALALRGTDTAEAHRLGEVLLGFANRAAAGWMLWFSSATVLGISDGKHDLRRRIEALKDLAKGRRARWLAGLAAFCMLAVIGLTHAPAQDGKKDGAGEPSEATAPSMTTSVKGIVVDESGGPVKNAEVRLSINLTGSSEQRDLKTGADGRFSFESVNKAASLNLRAKHADFAESSLLVFQGVSVSEERRLVLPAVSWVSGKVTDKRDGTPIQDARVFFGLEHQRAIPSLFEWTFPSARTNAAGEYRLPVKVRDLNEIIIRAWAPDMTSHAQSLAITGRETSFNAALEPVRRIPGKVVDDEGRPVEDALVWVVEDGVRLDETQLPITLELLKSKDRSKLALGKMIISLGLSKAGGEVGVHDVDPYLKDKLWVVALHPEAGFARKRARELQPEFIFKLEPWASLSGRILRSDGSPVAEQQVSIYAREGEGSSLFDPALLNIRHHLQFDTDKNGGFKIERLTPRLSFSAVTINRDYLPITPVTAGVGPQREKVLQMIPGSGLKLAGGVRAAQGRIVLPEGHSFNAAEYRIWMSITSRGATIPGMPRPDQDGRFMTEPLPPGDYEVTLSIMPRNHREMELPRDAGRWLRFKIEPEDESAPLALADIVLTKADLTLKPRADKAGTFPRPVYADGPDGMIEVTTMTAEHAPVPGVRIEVLDLVDHAHAPMGMQQALGNKAPVVSDENGKVVVRFPRAPASGRTACGVLVIGFAADGARSRQTELMDGRKSELRVYPETPVDITFADPVARWSACSVGGMIVADQPVTDGGIRARLALEHGNSLVISGTTADGRVLFSDALMRSANDGRVVREVLALAPGVEIEGRVENLPADYDGTGCVVARVYVKSTGELNVVAKGNPPAIPWRGWVPVDRDGRFHIAGMPRGMLSLTGLGKGWTVRGRLADESGVLTNIANASGTVHVTLGTRPCADRRVRFLLPDGRPAAGATVKFRLPGIDMYSPDMSQIVRSEDAGRHEQFKTASWTRQTAVADAEGRVLLSNQANGRNYCQVFWLDPDTQHPRWGDASIQLEDTTNGTPLEVKLAEK